MVANIHELHGGTSELSDSSAASAFGPCRASSARSKCARTLTPCRQLRPEMRDVGVLAAGIDDDQQAIAEVGDHQVIEDAAIVIGEEAVALAAVFQAKDIDRNQRFERLGGIIVGSGGGDEFDLTHVRDTSKRPAAARV